MVNANKASTLLIAAAIAFFPALCFVDTSEAQNQEQPKRVPPRLGERVIDPPITNESESASAHLFGMTLSAPSMVNACAHLYPEFSKENSAALEAWQHRHAEAVALIRRAARQVLLKHSGGNVARVEGTLQKHAMDAQAGTLEKMEREQPAVARKTCQSIPVTLTRGPFVLEKNPEFSVLRESLIYSPVTH